MGLYGNEGLGYLVLKIAYCNDPDGRAKADKEAERAQAISALPACGAPDLVWQKNSVVPFRSQDMLRAPLTSVYRDGCYYALYPYFPENLAEWLQHHGRRTPEQVTSIFLQLASILRCLKSKGFYYDDLKPSNILIWQNADGLPRVKIGDLGGLDRLGDSSITVTPSRLPPKMLASMRWEKVDTLTDFLLGELVLQLLLRPTAAGEHHPMNDFLACLHNEETDRCTRDVLAALRTRLADGLLLEDPRVRDLAALALNLLGYKGWYVSLNAATGMSSSLFQ